MSSTGETLMEFYRAMRSRFGHQAWWPGQTPLEICIGAILTQNTAWTNVEKALANLQAAEAMSLHRLHEMPAPQLASLIRPAGYFNIKAKRLKNFVAAVYPRWGENLGGIVKGRQVAQGDGFLDRDGATLREELLAINGIGRETADSIVLYAAGRCTFVVDAYTCRVLGRHRLIAPEDDYESVKDLLESNLPDDVELFNDFHAQFVMVGKTFCRPRSRCEGCPLEGFGHDVEETCNL
ncbi:MAG: Endonuclease III [Planctomycetes bacterium ADurb.Bin126]|nr:MAG: Endonuclease III [Planctomycetes bacterium ADurb.Bin126]HOD84330.1 endonuclease III domain-containing protein [Phycisphaerae bacterium]